MKSVIFMWASAGLPSLLKKDEGTGKRQNNKQPKGNPKELLPAESSAGAKALFNYFFDCGNQSDIILVAHVTDTDILCA